MMLDLYVTFECFPEHSDEAYDTVFVARGVGAFEDDINVTVLFDEVVKLEAEDEAFQDQISYGEDNYSSSIGS